MVHASPNPKGLGSDLPDPKGTGFASSDPKGGALPRPAPCAVVSPHPMVVLRRIPRLRAEGTSCQHACIMTNCHACAPLTTPRKNGMSHLDMTLAQIRCSYRVTHSHRATLWCQLLYHTCTFCIVSPKMAWRFTKDPVDHLSHPRSTRQWICTLMDVTLSLWLEGR
jgi:hypothetical protein